MLSKTRDLSRILDLSEGKKGLLSYCFHLWPMNARVTFERPIVHHNFGVTEVAYL